MRYVRRNIEKFAGFAAYNAKTIYLDDNQEVIDRLREGLDILDIRTQRVRKKRAPMNKTNGGTRYKEQLTEKQKALREKRAMACEGFTLKLNSNPDATVEERSRILEELVKASQENPNLRISPKQAIERYKIPAAALAKYADLLGSLEKGDNCFGWSVSRVRALQEILVNAPSS